MTSWDYTQGVIQGSSPESGDPGFVLGGITEAPDIQRESRHFPEVTLSERCTGSTLSHPSVTESRPFLGTHRLWAALHSKWELKSIPKPPSHHWGNKQTNRPLNGACWGAVARCIVCKELSAHVVLTSHFLIWDPQESWNSILIKTS